MAISYSVSKALATFFCNYRASNLGGGNYEYRRRRAFMSFDLTGSGLSVGTIDTVELILVCSALTLGGDTLRLRSATGSNGFGATLDATHADWSSSETNIEDTQAVNATGTYTFAVDKNNLDLNGVNYYRLANTAEGHGANYNTGAFFVSSTGATPPILRITTKSGMVILIPMI